MSEMNYNNIPASAFEFVPEEGRMHDKKLDSKPVGYFRDAFNRFCRNKSSVVAACIILVLVLYAIFVPIFCENTYTRALTDTMYLNYGKLPPKAEALGIDGTSVVTVNETTYQQLLAIQVETGLEPVVEIIRDKYQDPTASKKSFFYDLKVDNYEKMGMIYLTLTPEEFEKMQA